MAFTQFPRDQYFIVINDTVPTQAGSFTLAADTEIDSMICTLFKVGAHAGTETFQVHIYGNADLDTPVASSAAVATTDIDSLTSSGWAGKVKFDFARQHLDADNTYYIGIQINNYTPSGSYYWGWALDWPDDINTFSVALKRGLQFSLLGYE